ncbi:hypothetical protein Y032_0444g1563 [Ancylostoma ceylanicum]|uniref:Uncharacterized protein n=1 Tax=Ancylostoma ceylanicum TaxID=53326 RepID=A0A016X0C2_9BILA|nr:hypothetical protein Y032_0444g1563 [Ancylostoma ceylanicum]
MKSWVWVMMRQKWVGRQARSDNVSFSRNSKMTDTSRSRHESVGDTSPKCSGRDQRFPSPMVDSGQFLRIVSWRDPSDSESSTPSPPPADIAGTMRSWYHGISRRKLFIILVILVVVLFIAAVIITIVLVFVLQGHSKKDHDFTAVVFTVTTLPPPTTTPFPYLTGYVVGTLSRHVPIGVADSVEPDNRGFTFRQQLLVWGNNTLSLIGNNSVVQGQLLLDTKNCTSCGLLSAEDSCLTPGASLSCSQSQVIYCCFGCPQAQNLCRVRNVLYEFSDQLVEARISDNGEKLLVTTASQVNTSSCAIQTHRIGSDGSSFSGPIRSCYGQRSEGSGQDPHSVALATTTFSINSAIAADVLTAMDSDGTVKLYNLSSDGTTASVPMKIEGDVLSVSTTVQGDRLLVAFLQSSRFYALRLNLVSGCVSVLESYYYKFSYAGELRDFAWAGETLILWFVDRDGVNIVQFQFKWDSDTTC